MAQKANLSFRNRFSYISVIDEPSDFKFGMQLEFAKAQHKIPLEEKWVWLPEIWGFPLTFLQWLKLATSNLVYSLGLPRPIIKCHTEKKWTLSCTIGAPQNSRVPFINICATTEASNSNLAHSWGSPRSSIKTTTRRKVSVALG